jgi:hypothetical protein
MTCNPAIARDCSECNRTRCPLDDDFREENLYPLDPDSDDWWDD